MSIRWYISISVHPYIRRSVLWYVHTSVRMYVLMSVYPFIHPSVHPYIRMSVWSYIHTFVHPYKPYRPEAQPTRPEAQPARPKAQPARPEAQAASQPSLPLGYLFQQWIWLKTARNSSSSSSSNKDALLFVPKLSNCQNARFPHRDPLWAENEGINVNPNCHSL